MKKTVLVSLVALTLVSGSAHAAVILSVLTNATDIANFQAGATVQTFDNVAGLPGFNISNFNSNVATSTLTGSGQALLQFRNAGAGFITTSGGVAPTGVFHLASGLTPGAESGSNVLAPLDANQNTCFDSSSGCYMAFELLFEQGVQKLGFYMSGPGIFVAGTQDVVTTVDTSTNPVTIQRTGGTNFAFSNVSGGFVTLTSTTANITSVSIDVKTVPMFIDDVTYARSATPTSTPEPATLAISGVAFAALLLRKKLT